MVIIVDHVGCPVNNYYSDGLASAVRDAGLMSIVLSNYESSFAIKKFGSQGILNLFLGTVSLIFALIIRAKFRPTIIFHCFNGNLKVLLLAKLLSFFSDNLICIAHDPRSILLAGDSFKKDIYNLSKYICVHNDYSKEVLLNDFPKVNEESVIVINHGVDLSRFNPIAKEIARSALGIGNDKMVFLFFGQVRSSKNLQLVMKSLPYIKHLNPLVLVYGKFVEEDIFRYVDMIPENCSQFVVIEPGFVSDDKMTKLFSASDISLLPYKEIFQSGVLLTSFAFRLPVICSNIAGFSDLVADRSNGFLFESDNVLDFVRACCEANESDLRKISDNCFDTIQKRFTWESCVEVLVSRGVIKSSVARYDGEIDKKSS